MPDVAKSDSGTSTLYSSSFLYHAALCALTTIFLKWWPTVNNHENSMK